LTRVELPSKDVNEVLQLHQPAIFTDLLKQRKAIELSEEPTEKSLIISTEKEQAEEVSEGLSLSELNQLIGNSGIIGEENTRLLLFIIASSYKTNTPLHGIVQGSSGSGKTHLISKIAELMPPEDVLKFTRITESSLYNWGEWDLVGKCMIIEDLDGLKEEALYSLRELISNQQLSSSVSIKDKKGNIKSTRKKVRGQFSSLSATTKADIYEDNISRSFTLAVDESTSQSKKIIEYQNKRYAGELSKEQEKQAKKQLQEYLRNLQTIEVINPYATKLELPEEVHKIRRLNEMYQSIIRQITWLNQRQRKYSEGKIYTAIEDLEQATEILFESIILKIDELDGSLRQFYERLKKYLKAKDKEFTQREIRQALNISKSQCSRYIITLQSLEYIVSKHTGNLRKVV
jgi:DNA primase